jgi:hypothetical protein
MQYFPAHPNWCMPFFTAAHCVTKNGKVLAARDFIVYLGRHNLRNRKEEGSQEIDVCLLPKLHILLPIHYYFLHYILFHCYELRLLSVILKYTSITSI